METSSGECFDPLEALLASQRCWQSEQAREEQKAALGKLGEIIRTWEQTVAASKDHESEKACRLVCIGSYKLGVHLKESDIDLICIAPNWITRHDFNMFLVGLLQVTEGVSKLRPVPHASVPVLKFNLNGVDVDLLFARLEQEKVEEKQDFSTAGVVSDPQCQASLSGYLVTMALLEAVPDLLTFQIALAGIKIWAERRGVHGYRFGFPGGVSWSILVARECKENPLASPSTLVRQVLTTLVHWPWSDQQLELSSESLIPPGLPVSSMSILTPSEPPTNSTHTVSSSSLTVLQQEASNALALIEVGDCEEASAGFSSC